MKKLSYFIGIIIILMVGGLASWVTVETIILETSGPNFCQTCHSMQPMVNSYLDSPHGGQNSLGIVAQCTDCHVSHESALAHVGSKAESGVRDFWVTYFEDPDAINWSANRLRREEYVFDSGCLECHTNLERATRGNNKAFVAHKPYFLGETDDKCVSCHEHVGHLELSDYLNP